MAYLRDCLVSDAKVYLLGAKSEVASVKGRTVPTVWSTFSRTLDGSNPKSSEATDIDKSDVYLG